MKLEVKKFLEYQLTNIYDLTAQPASININDICRGGYHNIIQIFSR